MPTEPASTTRRVVVGGRRRPDLLADLRSAGVQLNDHAQTLLDDIDLDTVEHVDVVDVSVADLGLPDGAPFSGVFAAARRHGLRPCPTATGAFLRLAWIDQPASDDPSMSRGRAPDLAVTVASAPLTDDDHYPKGFYLRVVDGVPWLRGYRCDDEHLWSPTDRFVFRRD